MKLVGAISEFFPELGGLLVVINPMAVQLARHYESEDEKRKDIVNTIKNTLRKTPPTAYPIAIFILLVFIATAISQIGNAMKILGIIEAK